MFCVSVIVVSLLSRCRDANFPLLKTACTGTIIQQHIYKRTCPRVYSKLKSFGVKWWPTYTANVGFSTVQPPALKSEIYLMMSWSREVGAVRETDRGRPMKGKKKEGDLTDDLNQSVYLHISHTSLHVGRVSICKPRT